MNSAWSKTSKCKLFSTKSDKNQAKSEIIKNLSCTKQNNISPSKFFKIA